MATDIIMLMCHICDVSYQPSYEIYSVADCFSSSVCVCVYCYSVIYSVFLLRAGCGKLCGIKCSTKYTENNLGQIE